MAHEPKLQGLKEGASQVLPLKDMAGRHHGLTPAIAECYLEAARVCMDRHHASPTNFTVQDDDTTIRAQVEWDVTDDQCRNAWANETDTTEAGAYAFVLAATELTKGMVAVKRAETLTGADYYVAPSGQQPDDLENCFRLEVSGTDRGEPPAVARRLKEKIDQAASGDSNLPAMAGVVGFYAQLIMLKFVRTP